MIALNLDVMPGQCPACEKEMFGRRVQLDLRSDEDPDADPTPVEICASCAMRAADDAIQSWMR